MKVLLISKSNSFNKLLYSRNSVLTGTLTTKIALNGNSQSDQINKSCTCMTIITAALHGTSGNRSRAHRCAANIMIAAAPLGIFDVVSC